MIRVTCPAFAAIAVFLAVASDSFAQEAIPWEEFAVCVDCRLRLTEEVRLGDPDGDGIVESAFPQVVWSEMGYLLFHRGAPSVKLFGHDGRFVRSIGRSGEAPGEFSQSVHSVQVIGDRILVNDYRRRAFVIFDEAGDHLGEIVYGFKTGDFVSVGSNRVIIFSMDQSSDLVGYPLHLVDVSPDDGRTLPVHFGSRNPNSWSARIPWGEFIFGSVVSGPTVWWANAGGPRGQEWSADGEHLRTIEGELPWFTTITELIPDPSEPPAPKLSALAVCRDNRLWMLTNQPDEGWADVHRVEGGFYEKDIDRYSDSRLDVFDLDARRHLGSYTWDSGVIMLVDHGAGAADRVRISVPQFNDAMVPQVVIYRADWR